MGEHRNGRHGEHCYRNKKTQHAQQKTENAQPHLQMLKQKVFFIIIFRIWNLYTAIQTLSIQISQEENTVFYQLQCYLLG